MSLTARPLTLGEILDRTVQLYRRHFLLFVGVTIPPTALTVLIFGIVGIFFASQFPDIKQASGAGLPILIGAIFVVILVGLPLLLAAFALAVGASNYAILHAHRGEKVTIRASYSFAFRHFWRQLGILFLQGLFSWVVPYAVFVGISIVGGAILVAITAKSGPSTLASAVFLILWILLAITLFVTAVWLWLCFSLAFPASVAEDARVWPSMMRSWRLTKGARGRIFVMFLLVWILSIVVSVALAIPLVIAIALSMQKSFNSPDPPVAFMVALQTANLGISFLVRAFVMPIYMTSLTIFYFDQRTRQEGYDIEQLMSRAGWQPEPAAVPIAVPAPPVPQGFYVPPGQAPPDAHPVDTPPAEAAPVEPAPIAAAPIAAAPDPELPASEDRSE